MSRCRRCGVPMAREDGGRWEIVAADAGAAAIEETEGPAKRRLRFPWRRRSDVAAAD